MDRVLFTSARASLEFHPANEDEAPCFAVKRDGAYVISVEGATQWAFRVAFGEYRAAAAGRVHPNPEIDQARAA